MYTPLQVCNLALAKVGNEAAQITSLPAESDPDYPKEANLCAKFYPIALAEVLRAHPWNCAKKRVELAMKSTSPVFGFSYQFQLPADCLKPLDVSPEQQEWRSLRLNVEWFIEGRAVLTNYEQLYMLYVSNMADLTTADPLFIAALYTNLAIKLCYPLNENRLLVKDLMNEYETIIMPEAKRANTMEGNEFPAIDSEWLEASYGNGIYGITGAHKFTDANYGTI
jgi:hypothetical protein